MKVGDSEIGKYFCYRRTGVSVNEESGYSDLITKEVLTTFKEIAHVSMTKRTRPAPVAGQQALTRMIGVILVVSDALSQSERDTSAKFVT
jgi:hypothetical protein